MRRIVTGFAVLGLALAACSPSVDNPESPAPPGGGQPAGQAAVAKNPCQLVTSAELATVVATVDKLTTAPTVTQKEEAGDNQGLRCTWSYPRDGAISNTAEISVTAWNGRRYYTPDILDGFTEVPGIGDAAHQQASMFMFRKGEEVFLVSVFGDVNGAALRTAIAKLIVTKL